MSEAVILDAKAIADVYPARTPRQRENIVVPQIAHRIELIKFWDIRPSDRVLEIGCGQGDTTVTLAAAVGEHGHVTAIDPASLDYGNPYTLGEAQAHLRASTLGSRMQFVQADPMDFLTRTSEKYTAAVLSHCIWYFSSPSYLDKLLSALAQRAERICIAEWALTTSDPCSLPHVLAAFAQASMECHKPESKSNIRTVLSPAAITKSAETAGLRMLKEKTFAPVSGMLDGFWEVAAVKEDSWLQQIHDNVENEREKAVVIAMRDAVVSGSSAVLAKGEKIRSMDTWVAAYTIV